MRRALRTLFLSTRIAILAVAGLAGAALATDSNLWATVFALLAASLGAAHCVYLIHEMWTDRL
jgi:hypothetical protein